MDKIFFDNLSSYIDLSITRSKIESKDLDKQREEREREINRMISSMDKDELNETYYQIDSMLNRFEEKRYLTSKFPNNKEGNLMEDSITITALGHILDTIGEASRNKKK